MEDDDFIYMITPTNRLTKVDSITIPNLEKRKQLLESQLKQIPEAIHKSDSEDDIAKLQSAEQLTNSELKYVKSYLRILQKLKSVESCESTGSAEYDYEKEDMILDQIGKDMALLKEAEKEITQFHSNLNLVGCKDKQTKKMDDAEFVEDIRHVEI